MSFVAILLIFADMGSVVAVDKLQLQIRGAENSKFSRVVFDWGKKIPYKAKRSDGVIDIIFTASTTNVDMSKLNIKKLKYVRAVKKIKLPNRDTTHVRLALVDGAKHRGYRLGNRVIFDIYPPSIFKQKIGEKFVKRNSLKDLQKIVKMGIKPEKSPSKEIIVANDNINKAVEIDKVEKEDIKTNDIKIVTKVTKEEVKPEIIKKQQLLSGYTTVTISTIEPVALAVFERFGYLWIVADTSFATINPTVAGPFSGVLGVPKKIALNGAVAYRFVMPKQAEVASINSVNLSWIISLKPAADSLAKNLSGQLRRIARPKQKSEVEMTLPKANKILELFDEDVGEKLYVVTSSVANSRISLKNRYPEFEILKAYQGAVIKPYSEKIKIRKNLSDIIITAPNGIIMTRDVVTVPKLNNNKDLKDNISNAELTKLFDFYSWNKGGLNFLWQNERQIEAKLLNAARGSESANIYLELALLYFANGYGHEAIGALRAATMENPDLAKKPGFLAVKGASEALAGFPLLAIRDLTTEALIDHPEAKMWVGYAAAMSEQWKLAAENFPASNVIVLRYPPNIAIPFILYMAESSLRIGDTVQARVLLSSLGGMKKYMKAEQKAAEKYLLGEAYRQEGNYVKALKEWHKVVSGRDRLFYVKASIATVNLLRKLNRISSEDAQDRLETLRYVWRGDGLEIQMLHNIAKLYLDKKQYIRGLEEMRKAVILAEELLIDSSSLVKDMEKIFSNLFVKGGADNMEPFRAVAIYNSFKELKPVGYDSYIAEQNYARYLVEMDLLDDAANILEKQLQYDWGSKDKVTEIGLKLASIYLLDSKAKDAISVLQRTGGENLPPSIMQRRELLRAKALSEIGMVKTAIDTIKDIKSKEAIRLRADIYWQNKDWQQAASELEKLLPPPENVKSNPNNPANELILNTVVAYKLANNSDKLREFRNRYFDAIKLTQYNNSFALITRKDETNISIADRQAILDMATEVNLFKDFLHDYQNAKIY